MSYQFVSMLYPSRWTSHDVNNLLSSFVLNIPIEWFFKQPSIMKWEHKSQEFFALRYRTYISLLVVFEWVVRRSILLSIFSGNLTHMTPRYCIWNEHTVTLSCCVKRMGIRAPVTTGKNVCSQMRTSTFIRLTHWTYSTTVRNQNVSDISSDRSFQVWQFSVNFCCDGKGVNKFNI